MASFDIVNKVDMQELENAINNTRKALDTRYDFRGTDTKVDLDKKANRLRLETSDTMKLQALDSELVGNLARRGVDSKALDRKEPEPASKGRIRQEVVLKQGIDKETAKKIVKAIKDTKLKVQAQIQDDQVRVQGKKIDDLQEIIAQLKQKDFGVPLQFVNMKR